MSFCLFKVRTIQNQHTRGTKFVLLGLTITFAFSFLVFSSFFTSCCRCAPPFFLKGTMAPVLRLELVDVGDEHDKNAHSDTDDGSRTEARDSGC
jgi:hypothetical protein